MPMYVYKCEICDNVEDMYKSVVDIDVPEDCAVCGDEMERLVMAPFVEKSSFGEPYYEPGLGEVIKSKEHKRQVMKSKGVEEVGNESPDTMYKMFEEQREKRINKSWENV